MEENQSYETEMSPKEILKMMKTNTYDNFVKKQISFNF